MLFLIIISSILLFCLVKLPLTKLEAQNKSTRLRLLSSLKARAGPNKRLVEAFGIENSFTTTDADFHLKFITRIKSNLRRFSATRWRRLSILISELVREKKATLYKHDSKSVLLSPLIRNISFRLVMSMFFEEIPQSNLGDENVELVTDKINSLWRLSKISNNASKKEAQLEKAKLFDGLSSVFGKRIIEGPDNPLNIIIPAYETLWRVVYRCFLEIRFRFPQAQLLRTRETFQQFLETPNVHMLREGNIGSPSVEAIVNEALRLYPPTRRIHRLKEFGTINVEVEHRREEIWGRDACEFRPERWMREKFSKPENYMPFGKASKEGYFECPASKIVGPMMIAIMVAGLTNGIGDEYSLVEKLGDQPLSGERDGLDNLGIYIASETE